jgi:hypothetical protein
VPVAAAEPGDEDDPMRSLSVAAAVLSLSLVGLAAPAHAQVLAVDDPAGDAAAPGPDIVRAVVSNRDDRVVARVRFTRAVRGDVIVSVDPRGARGVRLVSEHRPAGTTRSYVLRGAFTDRGASDARVRCRGFRVRWAPKRPVVTMRLPSRCLRRGDYGAVRFSVLTERGGGDVDLAPRRASGSAWIPRG